VNGATWWYNNDDGKVLSEIQHPTIQSDPIGVQAQTIEYTKNIMNPATGKLELHNCVCEIKPVDFVIQISAVKGTGSYTWKNTQLWYALDSIVWQNAFKVTPDSNLANNSLTYTASYYRGAFPIIAWIGQYQNDVWTDQNGLEHKGFPTDTALNFFGLTPDLSGRFIDLYTNASNTYTVSLGSTQAQNTADMNQNQLDAYLAPNVLPDPRLSETAFFKITLDNFGPYIQPTGLLGSMSSVTTWYPAVYYRVRVVYAVYGDYVYQWNTQNAANVGYTNSTWTVRTTTSDTSVDPLTGLLNGIGALFSNPFTWILILLFCGIGVVVLWILAPVISKALSKVAAINVYGVRSGFRFNGG
jgi:hypothetical protein